MPSGGFWSGSVRYAGGRRYTVWARGCKAIAIAPRVIATEDLKPGRAIEASQVRVELREDFPAVNVFCDGPRTGSKAGGVLERLPSRIWNGPSLTMVGGAQGTYCAVTPYKWMCGMEART